MSTKLKSKMFRPPSSSLLSRMNQRNSVTKRKKTVEFKNGSFARCSPSLTNLLTRSKASKKSLPPRKLTKNGLAWSSMSSSTYLNRKQSNKITFCLARLSTVSACRPKLSRAKSTNLRNRRVQVDRKAHGLPKGQAD